MSEYADPVIVVVGNPVYSVSETADAVDGLPARVAVAAAAHGRPVQLVGKAGEDPEGDAVVLALAHGGVGHVAFLRDAGMITPRASGLDNDDADAPAQLLDGPATQLANGAKATERTALDAADIELALRYLTDFSVLVLAVPVDEAIARVVSAAAGWADARLIVIVPHGLAIPAGLPPDAIVFEGPDADPDGVFAEMVGGFAAALDDGDEPATAFRSTVEAGGWAPAEADTV